MECPKCRTELPLWAQRCLACGTVVVEAPPMRPPEGLEAPAAARAPHAPDPGLLPPPGPPKDYAPHLKAAAALAFVATLVVPPVTGPIASGIGYLVWTRGAGRQRQLGAWVMVAGIVATAIGMAVAVWVERVGLLTP